jgi:glycosyltransferase involved in cell wall biosynthesis
LDVPRTLRWEVIVVDNNSSDDTKSVVERFREFLNIAYIFEEKTGQSNARNTAIRESKGEILVWTDDDVIVEPDWVCRLLACHDTLEADVVFGRVLPMWETNPPNWFSKIFYPRFAILDLGDESFVSTSECGFGVNHSARRSVYNLIGEFRTDFGIRPVSYRGEASSKYAAGGGEDTFFFFEAHRKGLVVAYCGSAIVNHFIPADRCEKEYYRRRVWHSRKQCLIAIENDMSPRIFGIPRHLFRRFISNLIDYAKATITRQVDIQFDRELKIRTFVGLLHAVFFRG